MRYARLVGTVLFVATVPIFLIATNLRWVVNAPVLYSYGFDKYDIPARTGLDRAELISAGKQIRDYFNNDEEWLDVQVLGLYNDREIRHMRDVKGLVKGVYRTQMITGAVLALLIAAGLAKWRQGFLGTLARAVKLGGGVTLGLLALVGIGAVIGFDRLFLLFHQIGFSNDLWQLDPRTDYLIAMFPESFFFDATMWMAGSTVAEALLMVVVPWSIAWLARRGARPVDDGWGWVRPMRLARGRGRRVRERREDSS